MFDLIIKNASVVDGTGKPAFVADVAVKDGKIAAVGSLAEAQAEEIFDASGLTLTPGFIDIHSHSDMTLPLYPKAEGRILQGITTEIGGNCGESMAPARTETLDLLKTYMGQGDFTWRSFGEYLDYMEKGEFPISGETGGISVNLASLVGHGTVRIAAMGFEKRLCTYYELEDMKSILAEAMDQGAYGMTSGLIYPPGLYCDTHELAQLATVLGKKGGFYATHMRSESFQIEEAIDEAIKIAATGGCPLEISHFKLTRKETWHKRETIIKMVEDAQKAGLAVTCDQYPYVASSTGISSNLPGYVFEGGFGEVQRKLKDTEYRRKVVEESEANHAGRWNDIFVGYTPAEEFAWTIGKNMEEISREMGLPAAEIVCRMVDLTGNETTEVSFGQSEDVVQRIIQLPYVMTGSDGWAYDFNFPGRPHPRCCGTFPRLVGHYSRDLGLMPLETAIHKITGMPAEKVGITDRGLIKEGNWADLVIFDKDKIEDTPTFEKPLVACKGISRVYVNGVLTAENGIHTGAKAGKVLRKK